MQVNDQHKAIIIEEIRRFEGGYNRITEDRGGATKYGITQSTLSAWRNAQATPQDVQGLTEDEAIAIYWERYMERYANLTANEMLLRLLFDSAIQHGNVQATKMMQRAIRATDDGIIGPETRNAMRHAEPGAIYYQVLAQRARFYADILQHHPEQRIFAAGWINRVAYFIAPNISPEVITA